MPNNLDIKIVLPPNLKSLYLSDPEVLKSDQNKDYGLSDKGILNSSDNIFFGRASLDPIYNENKARLVFGVRLKRREILPDENFEQYIDLKTIRSLTLSNSPDFSNDSNSTIEIKNWPHDAADTDKNVKVTGSNKNYIYNLNPLSFYDSSVNFDSGNGYGRFEEEGNDLFIINNWPLSGNGGISTIFIRIIARSIEDTTDIIYPGNAAIFDQIAWQANPGLRPGLPVPILTYATENHILPPSKVFTGNKTLFRFAAASEQSSSIPAQINKDGLSEDSNIFGSGIARYIGDLIEVRPSLSTSGGVKQWLSSSVRYSTIGLPEANDSSSLTKFNFDGTVYTGQTTVVVNSTFSGTLSTTSSRGFNILLNESINPDTSLKDKPDYFAQAHIKLEVDTRKEFDYVLFFKFNRDNLAASNTNSNKEIGVELRCTNFLNTAKSFKLDSSTSTSILQVNNVAENISKDFIEGGLLEIYFSRLKRPFTINNPNDFDEKGIFKAYFTPFNRKEHSYLLANTTISGMGTSGWFTSAIKTNLTVLQNVGDLTYDVKEFIGGQGRLLLDVDLGDCKYDDVQLDLNKTTFTSDWTNQTNYTWKKHTQNLSTTEITTFLNTPYDYYISSRYVPRGRAYSELHALSPTFSDRTKINFSVHHLQGEFYLSLFTKQIQDTNTPIGSFLDEYNSLGSNPINQPALMIKFSENDIKLIQKVTPTNEIIVNDICQYNLRKTAYEQKELSLGLAKNIGTSNRLFTIYSAGGTQFPSVYYKKIVWSESNFTDERKGYLILDGLLANTSTTAVRNLSTSVSIFTSVSNQVSTAWKNDFNKNYRLYYSTGQSFFKNQNLGNLTDAAVLTTNTSNVVTYYTELFFEGESSLGYDSISTSLYYISSTQEQSLANLGDGAWESQFNLLKKPFSLDFALFADTYNFTKGSTTVTPILTSKTNYEYEYIYNGSALIMQPGKYSLFYKQDSPNEFLGIYKGLTTTISLINESEQNYIYSTTVSAKVIVRNLITEPEPFEITVSNAPLTDENLWITINRSGNQIASFSSNIKLPGDRFGLGWNVAIGTRSQVVSSFGSSTTQPATKDSRIILADISIAGLPPKQLLAQTDLDNQRHFMKAIAYSSYHKPLLGQLMLAGNTDFWNFDYTTKPINLNYVYFAQQFTVRSRSNETYCHPQLLELKFEDNRYLNNANEIIPNPQVRFHYFLDPIEPYLSSEDPQKLSYIGTSLTTTWIEGKIASNSNHDKPGFNVPNNLLIQFALDDNFGSTNGPQFANGQKYWMVIKVPQGMNLARTRGFEIATRVIKKDYQGTTFSEGVGSGNLEGWQIVPYTWFKLFHAYRERYDNVFPRATLQMRVGAESHAMISTEFSGLSRQLAVDLDAPNSSSDFNLFNYTNAISDKNRPVITEILQPSVRTALIKIKATDEESGNWLFRIGKETDFGNIEYTEWLDWDTYRLRDGENQPINNQISYSIFLYGSTWLKPDGTGADPYINSTTYDAQNTGTDGPRKIWVDVMDKVGNKSQSYPITLNGQLIALVDTVAPDATVSIVDDDNVEVDYTNANEVTVKVIANDTISSVKDMRFRTIDGNGTAAGWSQWYHYSEVSRRAIESNFTALAGPISVPEDSISGGLPIGAIPGGVPGSGTGGTGGTGGGNISTSTDEFFFAPTPSPISGLKRIEIQVRDYGNNALQPNSMWSTLLKDTYLSKNSFVTLSNTPTAFADGLLQFPRNIFINSSVVWSSSFETNSSVYLGAVKYDNFVKTQSQDEISFNNIIWNVANESAFELISIATGYYKRKIILNNSIDRIVLSINGVSIPLFGTVANDQTSYRIDSTYGYLIIRYIQNIPSFNNPIFTCTINRAEAQIYKWDANSVQRVAGFGYAGERIILCMVALNKEIIFGTGSGNLWAFDGLNFRGPLFTATDLSGNKLPITCICLHEFMHEDNPYIYIGTGKKSFIFRTVYSDTNSVISATASWERCKGEPFYDKNFTFTAFSSAYNAIFASTKNGKVFKYQRKLNRTNSNLETQTTIEFELKHSQADAYESKILPVRSSVSFANQVMVSIGDRPEIHSYTEKLKPVPTIGSNKITNLFEHRLTNVRAASTSLVNWTYTGTDLVGTNNEALILDGVSLQNNDRVLLKNQSNTIANGIYVYKFVSGSNTRLVRAMDMEQNSKIKVNTHVLCTSGNINTNTIFYLRSSQFKEYADLITGYDSLNFSNTKENTRYLFTKWTSYNFDKLFVDSPMSKGAFQFYVNNGQSDSRNQTQYVYTKNISDKNYEPEYRDVMIIRGTSESVLFETKTGSDWSLASGQIGPYTLDFEVRHVSGEGEQGFEIVGGNSLVSVKLSKTAVTISSGTKKVTKNFFNRDNAFTPYTVTPEKYPEIGLLAIWNFSTGNDEDSDNMFPDALRAGSLDNWRAIKFSTISTNTGVYSDNALKVQTALSNGIKGDPVIGIDRVTQLGPYFVADTHTYMTIRLAFEFVVNSSTAVSRIINNNISTRTGLIVEGQSYKIGNRLLLRGQTNPIENGIYKISAGSWSKEYTWDAAYFELDPNEKYYKHTNDLNDIEGPTYWNRSIDVANFKLKTFWDSNDFMTEESFRENQFVITPLTFSEEYTTYEIYPSWIGPVSSIYLEFENMKDISPVVVPSILIDYISIQTKSGYSTISKEFTPIRLSMCGQTRRDIKLWVGNFENPIIEEDDFVNLSNININPYIKFGKLNPEWASSEWSWASMKFHVGHVIPPVISDVQNFHPTFRFSSAGGAGQLVRHAGTIWCMTDGMYIRKSTDNPEDHAFKTWKYMPDEEIWRYQSPSSELIRVAGKQPRGNIKVFTAISYRNGLLAAGQLANVGNPNLRPEET